MLSGCAAAGGFEPPLPGVVETEGWRPERRSRLGSPERGAGSPNGLSEGFSCSVDEQTPPVSLTLNHLPFQGRQGHFVPVGRQVGAPYGCIWLLRRSHICNSCNRPGLKNILLALSGVIC